MNPGKPEDSAAPPYPAVPRWTEFDLLKRVIVQTAMDGFWITDLNGRILEANDAYCELSGYTRAELLGRTISDVEAAETPEETARHREKIASEGRDRFESRHRRKNGTVFDVEASVQHVPVDGGLFVVFIRDITGRKQAGEALRERERRLTSLLENVNEVIFFVDVEEEGRYRFVMVNPTFERTTGLKASQVVGKLVSEIIPEPSLSLVISNYRKAIQQGRPVSWEETTQYPTGSKIGYVTVTPVFNEQGICNSLVGTVYDITERKKLEGRFLQAQKMEAVGKLAGGIAHDFNNLLSVINSYSGFVLEGLPQDSPHRSDVEEVVKAGKRAAALTRQLLLFSRQQAIEARPLEIDALIMDMERMLKRIIGEDIVFTAALNARSAAVTGDRGQLEQVLMNLVVNARDAMPNGGTLTVRTEVVEIGADYCAGVPDATPGRFVRLCVQDSGTGMEKETMAHIFEPFFTTKGQGKGTGLGLSTVYGIVRHHGGFVHVYSEQGKGTTFKIYLPLPGAGVGTGQSETKDAPAPLPARKHARVLLVEDEESVRRVAVRILAKEGHTVEAAADCRAARGLFDREGGRFDVLVTDFTLPDGTGLELAQDLARRAPGTKVIITSGYTDDRIELSGLKERGILFVHKPFIGPELLDALAKALDR